MSKSKKVQKSVLKVPHEVQLDIKSSEGTIDETAGADSDVKEVMAKKYLKNEYENEKKPLRFNVPFEDEVEVTGKPKLISVGPASTPKPTTEAPPITTFNYKNVYNKSTETVTSRNEIVNPEKYKYEVISSESIKTAESRIPLKKDTKQEKKKIPKKEEEIKRQDTGFYVLPVNKVSSQVSDDNFDFVDLDEKVLESAGSSPGQSSRINIKKGPNGQEYEYVYYYYYYDDDEEGKNGTNTNKIREDKALGSTTEKIYNGHDGPASEAYEEIKSSTNGARYLPTESSVQKTRKQQRTEVEEKEEVSSSERTRGTDSRYKNINRQQEPANNEILPVTVRPASRSRGRITNAQPAPADDIPAIGEERLPANTRFPPRSRNNSPTASPQPQETTSRTRNRESSTQSRVRLPNLGLLDSSSFRTHSSDASIDEDPIHDAELQRRPGSRTHTTEAPDLKRDEITTLSHRRGRPTTTSTTPTSPRVIDESEIPVSRRPQGRRPVEIPVSEDPEEEEPVVEVEDKAERGNGRRPETTRISDLEEGDIGITRTPSEEETGEVKGTEVTTEDESTLGLTMMEKVAYDLYAILQQTQDENIQTNFVDGNTTDITTEDELYTEVTTFSTTTTTTTTEPTTTTTTTEAPSTVAAGRGRYRTRGGAGVGLAKTRGKLSTTTTTTEAPVEVTSQRARGRFQSHSRTPGGSRRVPKPKVEVEEEAAPKEEAPKPTVERTFGGRNRFRGGVKPATTSTTTTAAPSTASGAASIAGSRISSIDRYNSRRRGNRVSVSTTSQPTAEDNLETEQHQDAAPVNPPEEPAVKPASRNRIHTAGARPLRPGPRIPLNLAQRGRVQSTTVSAPVEAEEPVAEKELPEAEQPTSQGEEVQEPVVTPAPDALSRLKNRRLRIGPSGAQPRPSPSPVTPPANRKKLVSSLLPKRRPGEEKVVEKQEETVEERHEEEIYDEDASPSSIEPSSTTEADKGLPGLLNGRRRNLIRRPGTLYSRSQQQAEAA
ncbi:UNVERIFIED_CONTAM: hypothetical protein PYX00_004858 [Menopon gallinae]|uniref:Uncharacterized protein n=1 Tax=Menopon gallinae TaxID=328185 RepID=A0AAW2I602_9NEOP